MHKPTKTERMEIKDEGNKFWETKGKEMTNN
jgi:hypothetical protein